MKRCFNVAKTLLKFYGKRKMANPKMKSRKSQYVVQRDPRYTLWNKPLSKR